MNNILISELSRTKIDEFLKKPNRPVMLHGLQWLNKDQIALILAARALDVKDILKYPYLLHIGRTNRNIKVEEVRELNNFLKLKVPSNKPINRVAIIHHAERMNLSSQNALLKNLEEPPLNTLLILISSQPSKLLLTIRSRLTNILISPPTTQEIMDFYQKEYSLDEIKIAAQVNSNSPKLITRYLKNQENKDNPDIIKAREFITGSTYQRLLMIDELSKDKKELEKFILILKNMSRSAINQSNSKSINKWRQILKEAINAEMSLNSNVQTKLILLKLILDINK